MTKKISLAFLALFTGVTFSFAQKIGHINSQDLMLLMPERKQAESAMQDYAKQLEGQLATMNSDYEAKVQEYQTKESVMTDLIKQDKAKEINDLEGRIRAFQQSAQESLQKKEQELMQPMIEKAKKAIAEVAKENSYKYVLDTSLGTVLYEEDNDNIMSLVKKKLNLTDAPVKDVKTPAKDAGKAPAKK
ncbi:MAG: OmpH family outer membrane protein [Bacteroidia bacterium]|nr:OmpH family outer membrane protein [Bacteroidia bacterium]